MCWYLFGCVCLCDNYTIGLPFIVVILSVREGGRERERERKRERERNLIGHDSIIIDPISHVLATAERRVPIK